jgi:hypothetical protein
MEVSVRLTSTSVAEATFATRWGKGHLVAKKIQVLSREVRITGVNEQDYICLTDIARYKNEDASDDLIRNWLRNRNTI